MVIKRVFVCVVREFSKVNSLQDMLSTQSTCDGPARLGQLEKKQNYRVNSRDSRKDTVIVRELNRKG